MRIGRWAGWAGVAALALGGATACSCQSAGEAEPRKAPQARLVIPLGSSQAQTLFSLGAVFSPDSKFVVTASGDNMAILWDVASGAELRRFEGHTGAVESVAFSPDGRNVLTSGADGTARLWDVRDGKEVRQFSAATAANPEQEDAGRIAFSPDGRSIVRAGDDGTALLWDVASGKELRRFKDGSDALQSVAFSPDGRYLLTSSSYQDNAARLWDVATGRLLRRFSATSGGMFSAAFSPDGRTILTGMGSGKGDGEVFQWDVANGRILRQYKVHPPDNRDGNVLSVAVSLDARFIMTATESDAAMLWDAASGRMLHRFANPSDGIYSVAFSPDGRTVLTDNSKAIVQLWDITSGQEIRRLEGRTSAVASVAFTRNARYAVTASHDGVAQLWDLENGKQANRFVDPAGAIKSLALTPDSESVLTGNSAGTTRLWKLEDGKELFRFETHSPVNLITISPDGHTALTAEGDKTARLWDLANGQELARVPGNNLSIESVAFSPDGRSVLLGGWAEVQQRDAGSLNLLRSFNNDPGNTSMLAPLKAVSFSPDGRTVFTGSHESTAWLWDATSGKLLQSFHGSYGFLNSIAFTPDGRSVLTGSSDTTARLWDTASGKEIRRLEGHSVPVNFVAVLPDGRSLATGNEDGTTRVWDTATGKELVSLISFKDGGWAVVDPSGRFDTNDLDGGAPLNWIVDDDPMHSLPLEIFMRDYYTPGLLARVMRGEKLPAVRSIAEIKNRVQPEVRVTSVVPSQTTPGRVDVTVHAASVTDAAGMKSGLQDLRLFRDGQMVAGGYREGTLPDGDFVFRDVMLKRDAKKAVFTAYAFSSERVKSATVMLGYEPTMRIEAAAVKRRAFLLQVGVNHTAATGCELSYSVNDAEAMSAALRERLEKQGFDVVAVKLESAAGSDASGATKGLIRDGLKKIAANATPDDSFFMSFSGHGYAAADGSFYVLPSSLEGSCLHVDAKLLASAISAEELAEWLRPIDAGEMTLILDACHSAESVQAGDFRPGPMGSRGLGQAAYDKRMRVLAASQSDAVAYEFDYLHQGLLSYVLVADGLSASKADWKPKDGKIMVGEWLSYAAAAVPDFKPAAPTGENKGTTPEKKTEGAKTVGQVPALFDFSREDTVVLAK